MVSSVGRGSSASPRPILAAERLVPSSGRCLITRREPLSLMPMGWPDSGTHTHQAKVSLEGDRQSAPLLVTWSPALVGAPPPRPDQFSPPKGSSLRVVDASSLEGNRLA